MNNKEIKEFLDSLKKFENLDLQQRTEVYAKIWPKMTEEEARKILQRHLESMCTKRTDGDFSWWIGEVLYHDYTGYIFLAGIYEKSKGKAGDNGIRFGVDALRKTCGFDIM